jgi:C1A family cysteine protease
VAAGYDDTKRIQGIAAGAPETTGALLIRNSWGTGWGDGGYGWLPYEYVLASLAQDWWSLIKADWVDSGVFGLSS